MYILVDKSCILLGIFTDLDKLKVAADVVKTKKGVDTMYYQEINVDMFDKTLINFSTMHPEKLNIV